MAKNYGEYPARSPHRNEPFITGTGLQRLDFHVEGDFGADDKDRKVVARKKHEMVRGINANTFNGSEKVSCYPCHRGDAHSILSAR